MPVKSPRCLPDPRLGWGTRPQGPATDGGAELSASAASIVWGALAVIMAVGIVVALLAGATFSAFGAVIVIAAAIGLGGQVELLRRP